MASTNTRNHPHANQKAIGPMATARQAFWPLVLLKVGLRVIGKLFKLLVFAVAAIVFALVAMVVLCVLLVMKQEVKSKR